MQKQPGQLSPQNTKPASIQYFRQYSNVISWPDKKTRLINLEAATKNIAVSFLSWKSTKNGTIWHEFTSRNASTSQTFAKMLVTAQDNLKAKPKQTNKLFLKTTKPQSSYKQQVQIMSDPKN